MSKDSLSVPITMICQLTRLAVAAGFIWLSVSGAIFWSDKDKILRAANAVAGRALEPISDFQQAVGFLDVLVSSFAAAVFVVTVWRLFGHYIAGCIFDQQAVSAFRAMAHAGIAFYFVNLVMRVVALAIVINVGFTVLFNSNDVLNGTFVLLLVIMAEIFSVGAAISREHSQIV